MHVHRRACPSFTEPKKKTTGTKMFGISLLSVDPIILNAQRTEIRSLCQISIPIRINFQCWRRFFSSYFNVPRNDWTQFFCCWKNPKYVMLKYYYKSQISFWTLNHFGNERFTGWFFFWSVQYNNRLVDTKLNWIRHWRCAKEKEINFGRWNGF